MQFLQQIYYTGWRAVAPSVQVDEPSPPVNEFNFETIVDESEFDELRGKIATLELRIHQIEERIQQYDQRMDRLDRLMSSIEDYESDKDQTNREFEEPAKFEDVPEQPMSEPEPEPEPETSKPKEE